MLYDRDHYKLALGQISMCLNLIRKVGKDYLRLLKFGDSLFRCKSLKRAAMGRMCTIMKRQKPSLEYLEQVRQHLARLPSIDPSARTLIVCGYPNVGKSSFMNRVTRADVEVQPYAFTTQSLFVGHTDYKYVTWQVIDTPGVLDHPLQDMNTIEMQSITALAHIRAAILFFIDISGQCGFSVQQQCDLFRNISALFVNKPLTLVLNKIDVLRPEDLPAEDKAALQSLISDGVEMMAMSTLTEEGISEVKENACERLLAMRVEMKMQTANVDSLRSRLQIAVPAPRDDVERPPHVPEAVAARRAAMQDDDIPAYRTLRDIERDNGGAGVWSVDLRREHILENEDWRYDVVPEILDGHNVADFVDPDILAKLDALEREEEALAAQAEAEAQAEADAASDDALADARKNTLKTIRHKLSVNRATARLKSAHPLPRSKLRLDPNDIEKLEEKGYDTRAARARLAVDSEDYMRTRERERSRSRSRVRVGNGRRTSDSDASSGSAGMDVDSEHAGSAKSISAIDRAKRRNAPTPRTEAGFARDKKAIKRAETLRKRGQADFQRRGQRGEGDHEIDIKMPKHLFSGKRDMGTHDRR